MDYEEEYDSRYDRYQEYHKINNSRAYHLYDFWHRFGPWWEDWRSKYPWKYPRRNDKYKSQRKGRC